MEIRIKELSKSFGQHQALDRIDLVIKKGTFGLLGPNGAGKSTFMQILATLLRPTSGEVEFGNYKLGKDDHDIRKLLGYLPQEIGLYERLTGEEFLHYIAILKGIRDKVERRKHVDRSLEIVNLSDQRTRKIKSYSGGMKQRIGIAQALLGDPSIIIVDEPTAGLDPEERTRFRQLLADLSEERIVILSTHIVADIESSCSNLAVLKNGRIRYAGEPESLLQRYGGTVWNGHIQTVAELNRISGLITNKRKTMNGFDVRVLSPTKPFENAMVASPNLEDAYIMLVGEGTHA